MAIWSSPRLAVMAQRPCSSTAREQLPSPCGEWALDGRRVAAFGCDALEGTVIDSLDTSLVRLLTWMGTNRLRWPWGRRQRDDA